MIILFQLLLGWLLADLISGLLHWTEDRVLWVGMPLISKSIVEPNRLHHEQPGAFLKGSIWSRNSTLWITVTVIAANWLLFIGFSFVWLGALLGGLVVQEVHALCHRGYNRPGWIRVVQQTGLIKSPAAHAGHHRGDHDTSYCILTGWLNPWLDWMGLWSRLEKTLTKIGLEPNRGTK